jgi:GxxExxY protein
MELNQISGKIIENSVKVHRALGPGMLESAYEACLFYELCRAGLKVEKQVTLPILYEGVVIDAGYRIDLFVENEVIVELKAVEKLHPIHKAQLLSYLKLSDKRLGLLINFNVKLLKDGVERVVNNFREGTED